MTTQKKVARRKLSVGKVYLQTAIDCFSRYAWARLYPNKLPLTRCSY